MVSAHSQKVRAIAEDVRGKHFLVTGANTGIGYVTARELAKMGGTVTMACRSAERGQSAIDKLRREALEKPVRQVQASILLSTAQLFLYVR